MAAQSIVLLKPEPCIPRGTDAPQLRGAGPSRCSPCTSQTVWVYSNELETALKKATKEYKGFAFDRRPYSTLHLWVVKCFANLLLEHTPEKYTGGSGKGGPELKTHTSKAQATYQVWCSSQKLSIPVHLHQLSPSCSGRGEQTC